MIGIGPFLVQGDIVGTDMCMHSGLNPTLVQITVAINTFYATCVIFATSNGLIIYPMKAHGPSEKAGFLEAFKSVIMAKDMPSFSKSLLRHGQVYYL